MPGKRVKCRRPARQASMKNAEFFDELFKYFKRYTKFPDPGAEIKCIRRSLEVFSPHIRNSERANRYLEYVYSIMEIFRSTNQNLIRNWLEEFIVRKIKEIGLAAFGTKLKQLSLLEHSPDRDIYYVIAAGHRLKVSADSLFCEKFIYADLLCMTRLLRYGVTLHLEDYILRSYQDDRLLLILQHTGLRNESYTEIKKEREELRLRITDNYRTYLDRRRLYFLMMAIDTVNDPHQKNFVESLHLVFKTIRDPLITVPEIMRLFDIGFKGQTNERKIRDFCNAFKKLFPSCTQPIQPRSLQHLCRCQLRGHLAKIEKLPHGIWSLDLPNKLKKYIMLQKTDDYQESLTRTLAPRKRKKFYNTRRPSNQKKPRFQ